MTEALKLEAITEECPALSTGEARDAGYDSASGTIEVSCSRQECQYNDSKTCIVYGQIPTNE